MDTQPEEGYLVLADVSGFTSYLATTELDHAHDILHDLMEKLIASMEPLLTRIEVEGDAVFAYAPAARIPRGETLMEAIEAAYDAFRDRVASVQRSTTCECKACRDIPKLDLKFIVHGGKYVARQYAGSFNLLGSDVNLVHRLLKNHVEEETGWRAYALFTAPTLQELNVQPEGMRQSTERYEHFDPITTYSYDLRPLHERRQAARRVFISAEEADAVAEQDVAAPSAIVWSHLHDAVLRGKWARAVVTPTKRDNGRMGIGAGNHCAHGKQVRVETIVDWKPLDYFTADMQMGAVTCRYTFQLVPTESGTRVSANVKMLSGPAPGVLLRLMARRAWKKEMAPSLVRLAALCEAAAAESLTSTSMSVSTA